MANQKNNKKSIKAIGKEVDKYNTLFVDSLRRARPSDNSNRDIEVSNIREKISDIIGTSFNTMSNSSEANYDVFFNNLAKNSAVMNRGGINSIETLEDLFEMNGDSILDVLRKERADQFIRYTDLEIITENINEIMLAVDITRDAILQGDDPLEEVARTITVTGQSDDGQDIDIITKLESMEKDTGIQDKLRRHVIKNMLIYGKTYVYTTPYSEIFKHHVRRMRRMMGIGQSRGVTESTDMSIVEQIAEQVNDEYGGNSIVIESSVIDSLYKNSNNRPEIPSIADKREYNNGIKAITESIKVNNTYTPIPFVEEGWEHVGYALESNQVVTESKQDTTEMKMDDKKSRSDFLRSIASRGRKNAHSGRHTTANTYNGGYVDGVMGVGSLNEEEYQSIEGVYTRIINPQNLIPIKVMNHTLGYYYIYGERRSTKSRSSIGRTVSLDVSDISNTNDYGANSIINVLTQEIVRQLDKGFLEQNARFKELIASSLIHNNIENFGMTYQFIPAEYITEFSINHDTDGEGQSIIEPSLIKAKLYLILLYFNVLTTLNLSTDQRMVYVHSSGANQDMSNRIQRIARSHKRLEVSATDLLGNFRSLFNKAGAGKTIYAPVGPDGHRSLDYEILEGQDVKIDSDFLQTLKTDAINATNVPAIMIEHVREVDYARRFDMAHSMFLSNTTSYKKVISPSITELYQKLALYGGYLDESQIDSFDVKLTPSKYLNGSIFNDILSNAESASQVLSEIFMGSNQEHDEIDNITSDIMRAEILKEMSSSLDLDKYEKIYDEARIKANTLAANKKRSSINNQNAEKSYEDLSNTDPSNSPYY